jgi:hypothetical protein
MLVAPDPHDDSVYRYNDEKQEIQIDTHPNKTSQSEYSPTQTP